MHLNYEQKENNISAQDLKGTKKMNKTTKIKDMTKMYIRKF